MCRKSICLILSIVVLILCAEPLSSRARADLIGYWKFDEGSGTIAADSAGGDNDGTLIGDGLEWVEGRAGGALSILYTDADTDAGVEFPTTGMSATAGTVAMWSYLDDPQAPTSGRYFFGHTTQPQWTNRVQIYMQDADTSNPTTLLDIGLGGTHAHDVDIVELPLEEWVHVALTWDSGAYAVYVNGEEVAAGSYSGLTDIHPTANIGNDGSSGPYEAFVGKLDEVRLYDHALDAAEIYDVMTVEPFPQASGPSPKDGALHLDTWVNLEWRVGDFAVSHDVYLGDNFDDVNDGAAHTFLGNQTATTLLAGFPGFAVPDGFVPGTTYYWRVDEVNEADPNSPWKGNVWSFSLPPKTAYFPDPPDGAEFVDPNATLSWTAGDGAKLHTFYIGESFDEVNDATGGAMSGTTSFNPGPLESEKVYYWRVDEFDGIETYKGDVWAFTTPGAAGNSQPANGAVDVPMIATLSWTAADNATSHELYFGTDAEAVNNATTASPEYVGPRALGAESYDPGGLDWKSSYAWRVDEVYPTGTVKGLVWTFTTADFITVDDFESYDDIDPLPGEPGLNRIFDKWIDGFGTTTNGALVGNDLPPYAETQIVHGGAQSMIYGYDNNLKTSEATLTLVYPTDWTEGGVTKLVLWFRGASANAADKLFIALNGTAVVYHEDPAATQMTGWNQWVMDLQAFADQGLSLTNVSTITI
ncbi:MAG: LamG domain-containing protein, partial [Planctomycetota bacterium]